MVTLRQTKAAGYLLLLLFVPGLAFAPITRFDEFGDIRCEDEMARLDNFAIQLLHEPQAKGVIIFYGGRRFRGRLPRRDEAEARAGRMKPYLVNRRGIPASRIIVINGGYDDEWHAQLWVVPPGVKMPTGDAPGATRTAKFRKGNINRRDYRCQI